MKAVAIERPMQVPHPPAARGAPPSMATPAPLLRLDQASARAGAAHFGPYSLALEAGERVALIGPSGAGKSTLLKLLAGELAAHDGSVWLEGRTLRTWTLPELAQRRAVLPQSHAVAFGLEASLVVSLGRVARDHDPHQARIVADALALAQAGPLARRRFDTLSGGEQARVQLARVFAQLWDQTHALLLVDEPLAALDPGLQFELMDALQAFAAERGHALVVVLHDLNQVLAGFDRLWLIQQGRLIADLAAGPDALPALERLYGIALAWVGPEHGGPAVIAQRRRAAPTPGPIPAPVAPENPR